MSYFGSKNGSGSMQQIINEIPVVDKVIIGFLGNCPVFKYLRDQVDISAYEISQNVINKYWAGGSEDIVCKDFISDLAYINPSTLAKGKIFVYCDPPYLMETRKSSRNVYEFELLEYRHIELLQQLIKFPGYVAISCYDNELYKSTLVGWRKKSWKVTTRAGVAIEALYMNYESPSELLCYDFLGKNNTDRQRIKRKIERFKLKFSKLNHLEKKAIIKSLTDNL